MSSGRVVLGLLLSAGTAIGVHGQLDCNSSEWVSNSWCKWGAQCTPCVRFLYNLQPCAGAWCTEYPRRAVSAQLPICLVLDSTYPPPFSEVWWPDPEDTTVRRRVFSAEYLWEDFCYAARAWSCICGWENQTCQCRVRVHSLLKKILFSMRGVELQPMPYPGGGGSKVIVILRCVTALRFELIARLGTSERIGIGVMSDWTKWGCRVGSFTIAAFGKLRGRLTPVPEASIMRMTSARS